MKHLETKHKRNAARITTLLMLILLLLMFFMGQTYMDPPEEYGVAVNFGNSPVGSGNVQPNKPVKSQDLNVNKPPQEVQSKPEESQSSTSEEVNEDIITQNTEEALAIKKAEEKRKAQAEADRIVKEKAAAEEKRRQEEAEKKRKLDKMMGGLNTSEGEASGSEGNDNEGGDKGQQNGDPYAPVVYFGTPGSGNGSVGYGLRGRGKATKFIVIPDCQEEGRVVVEIHVNQSGKVIKAIPGKKGTTGDACLFEAAKKTALSHKWPADSKAPTKQIGYVKIDFTVGQ